VRACHPIAMSAPVWHFFLTAFIVGGVCRSLPAQSTAPLILKGISTNAFGAFRDGSRFVCAVGQAVELWDRTSGQRVLTIKHSDIVIAVAVASDERTILTITVGKTNPAYLWNLADGGVIREYPSPAPDVETTGKREQDRTWELAFRRCVPEAGFGFTSAAFSMNGNSFVTGDNVGNIVVWNTETRDRMAQMTDGSRRIRSIAFSPDGDRVLSYSSDGILRLWDVAAKSVIRRYTARGGQNSTPTVSVAFAFSPDGSQFAFGDTDTLPKSVVAFLQACHASTGDIVCEMTNRIVDESGAASIVRAGCVAFLPAGRMLSNTGSILQVWDIQREAVTHRYQYESVINPGYAYPSVAFVEYLPTIDAAVVVEVENDENTLHQDWTVFSVVPLAEFSQVYEQ